jgi:hypothetical protein
MQGVHGLVGGLQQVGRHVLDAHPRQRLHSSAKPASPAAPLITAAASTCRPGR